MLPYLQLHASVVATAGCKPHHSNSLGQASAPCRSVTLSPKHWLSIARAQLLRKPFPQLGVHANSLQEGSCMRLMPAKAELQQNCLEAG